MAPIADHHLLGAFEESHEQAEIHFADGSLAYDGGTIDFFDSLEASQFFGAIISSKTSGPKEPDKPQNSTKTSSKLF